MREKLLDKYRIFRLFLTYESVIHMKDKIVMCYSCIVMIRFNQFSVIIWLQTKSNIQFWNLKRTLKYRMFNVAQSIRTYINSCHISVCCFKSRNFTTLNRHLKQRDKF